MATTEGTRGIKEWKGSYSFAVDGGTIGSKVLRSSDGPIPNGSVILGGYIDVQTIAASGGAATVALSSAEGAGDVLAATAFDGAPWSSTGRKNIVQDFTGAHTVKTSAARSPTVAIAAAALTALKFDLVLFFK